MEFSREEVKKNQRHTTNNLQETSAFPLNLTLFLANVYHLIQDEVLC